MKKIVSSSIVLLISSSLWLADFNSINAAVTPQASPSPSNNKLKISSQEAKYDRKNKIALATGNVKIVQDNTTIYTSSVLYNQGIQTSFIDQFVRIIHLDKETKRKTDISSNKMIVYHQEKKVHLEDKVKFDREEERKVEIKIPVPNSDKEKTEQAIKRERTVITSNEVDYWTKTGDAMFKGNAIVLQKEKRASGEIIEVKNDSNKNTDTIKITQNAKITQIRGDWLVEEKILDPKGDKEKERLVKEQLDMEANEITIFQKTSDLIGKGNVKIVQIVGSKKREAVGENAVFNDISKTMTLTGNVKIKRENEDWLTAQKAVFHTDSENFEAYANDPSGTINENNRVESVFEIPDDENSSPETPINTPKPYFDLGEKNSSPSDKKIPLPPNPVKTPEAKPTIPSVVLTPPPPLKSITNKTDKNPYEINTKPLNNPNPRSTNAPVQTKVNSSNSTQKTGEINLPSDNQ
jgi:lipopolysaccharide export system protein LptA